MAIQPKQPKVQPPKAGTLETVLNISYIVSVIMLSFGVIRLTVSNRGDGTIYLFLIGLGIIFVILFILNKLQIYAKTNELCLLFYFIATIGVYYGVYSLVTEINANEAARERHYQQIVEQVQREKQATPATTPKSP